MNYIDVIWRHSTPSDPTRLVSELDDTRFERRKLEFFPDGSVGFADKESHSAQTRLGEVAVPPLTEINQDIQFDGTEISKATFEDLWAKHRGP